MLYVNYISNKSQVLKINKVSSIAWSVLFTGAHEVNCYDSSYLLRVKHSPSACTNLENAITTIFLEIFSFPVYRKLHVSF